MLAKSQLRLCRLAVAWWCVTAAVASAATFGGSGYLGHPPEHLSASDCRGRRTTCLDESTLLHCLPVLNKVVPAFVESCHSSTPACVNGKCVEWPTWKRRPVLRDTQPEPDLSKVDCNGKSSVCLNCTMTVHCIQSGDNFFPVIPTQCPFNTPFCVDGKCGTKDPGHCTVQPPPESTFKCAEGVLGYLPDPHNCSVYHFCAQKAAYDYKCAADSLMYNHQRALCLQAQAQGKCFTFECTRPLEYVVYEPDPSVYALCKGSGAAGAILARCPDNHTFNKSTEVCSRTCVEEGRQPDPDNVNAYFECSKVDSQWLLTAAVCPPGAKFDADTQRCVFNG